MKLYHVSLQRGLTKLKPYAQRHKSRPVGVYLSDIHHIGLWSAVVYGAYPDSELHYYEVDLPGEKVVLYGEDNFTNYDYDEKTIEECLRLMNKLPAQYAAEVVIREEIPCRELSWNRERVGLYHQSQLFHQEMKGRQALYNKEPDPGWDWDDSQKTYWQYKELLS